jgi:hypothetical protein
MKIVKTNFVIFAVIVLYQLTAAQNDSGFFDKLFNKVSSPLLLKVTPQNVNEYFKDVLPLVVQDKKDSLCVFFIKENSKIPISKCKIGFSKYYPSVNKGWALEYLSINFTDSHDFIKYKDRMFHILGKKINEHEVNGAHTLSWPMNKYSADLFLEKNENYSQLRMLIQIINEDSEE